MINSNQLEIITRDAGASKLHSHAGEAVKEPHFLDFRLCIINNLQVKNCQFWEFFYSLWSMGTRKHNYVNPVNYEN